jgi:anti-sigma factor RsiW
MTYETRLSCEELVELVTDYLDGALDAVTERRFREHLARCDACAVYLEQMRTTVRLLGSIPPDSFAPAIRERLLDAFHDWRHENRHPCEP